MFFILLCCVAALCKGVLGEGESRVKNTNDFIQFSRNVSSGTDYSGTTVFLDADIDFSGGPSEKFEPIGNTASISKDHLMDKATQSAILQ